VDRTYIFRNAEAVRLSISLIVGVVFAYFEVHTARPFDVPRALC
jgi:hypothetical protein